VELDDEDNLAVVSAMKGKLFVFPHLEDLTYLTSAGAKVKSNGWKFPIASLENATGAISSLGLALLRAYSANLQMLELVDGYYEIIVPGAVSRADLSPMNNFYAQWEAALEEGGVCPAHARHMTGTGSVGDRFRLVGWITRELRLLDDGPVAKPMYIALGLSEDGTAPVVIPDDTDEDDFVPPAVAPIRARAHSVTILTGDVTRPLTEAEAALAREWAREKFTTKEKKVEKSRGEAALTKLVPKSKVLLERVARLSPHVAKNLAAWLRGFSAERLQEAAATLGIAKFDELFIHENVIDTESLNGDYDDNWANEVQGAADSYS
jgi:hypothetical protein